MTESNARLLEPHELAEFGPAAATLLPLDLVDPNPQNPRQRLVEVDELSQSIGDPKFGLLQPIIVRRAGERFEVIGGHRRLAAFHLLRDQRPHEPQWRVIPAVVRSMDDDDQAYLAMLEVQIQIRPFTPREEATALEALAVTRTYKEIGKLVHKSEAWAGKRLRIYSDAVLSGFVQSGRLAPSVAQELLPVKQAAQRRELAERAVAEQWGQVEARAAVRALKASRMVSQIGRLSRDLLAALALVRPEQIPDETGKTLLRLRRRITLMGRGPVIPSIEAAQQAAGVNPERPSRRRRRPAGYVKGREPKR